MKNQIPNLNSSNLGCLVVCTTLLFAGGLTSQKLGAVVPVSKKHKNFTTNVYDFKTSINLEVKDRKIHLPLPIKKIKKRLRNYKDDVRVEPITLNIFPTDGEIKKFAKRFAKPDRYNQTVDLLREKVKKSPYHHKLKDRKVMTFVANDFKNLDMKAVSSFFTRTHHEIYIDPDALVHDPALRANLYSQVRPYIGHEKLQDLHTKIENNETISLSKDLLPKFARKRVEKHSIYRGPNCFHSAISFNSEDLPKSNKINIKEEKNYHRAMLNYDELWRVLNSHFYEINPKEARLKFGDVLVFFDRVEGEQTSYKWIKHTTAYLFGPYTFSKGSKSANTPYSVNTINEEWATWLKFTKNMGVKVYRYGQRAPNEISHSDLIDWLY